MQELLSRSVENMLALSTKSLKDYLLEAKDHKIITERIDQQGFTYLQMSYAPHLLEKIAKDQLDFDQ